MNPKKYSEKGQILVLLALVLIGLLGFTALAVDGGMIFADQRFSQSSADAASLAGGGAAADIISPETVLNCSDPNGPAMAAVAAAYTAAYEKAFLNGYDVKNDPSLGDVVVDCQPKYIDVDVTLNRVTVTSFVHLFNPNGEMRTTVFSKTRTELGKPGSGGESIVSLGKEEKNKKGCTWFEGNNVTILNGGGLYANACVSDLSAAGDVVFNDGADITFHEGSYTAGFPEDLTTADPWFHPYTTVPLPDPGGNCSKLPNRGESIDQDGVTLEPGNYTDWSIKGAVTLNPGLYCITGTVKMNSNDSYVRGNGVTIYYTGNSFTLNGGSDTGLQALNGNPPGYVHPDNYAVEDLLLYVPAQDYPPEYYNGNPVITLNGNSSNSFGGTLFMPDSLVKINGTAETGDAGMTCSIIGLEVTLSGTSDLEITYDSTRDWTWPATVQLQQ